MKIVKTIILFLTLFVASCSRPITSGTVIGHKLEKEHDEIYPLIVNEIVIFIPNHYEDRYFIQVDDNNGHKQWIEVSKETHNKLKTGDVWKK